MKSIPWRRGRGKPASTPRDIRTYQSLYPALTGFYHADEHMKIIADLCIIPLGIGVSVSAEIAVCERILQRGGAQDLAPRLWHQYRRGMG